MNRILRSVLYRLTDKRVDEKNIDPVEMCVKKEDVSYFNLSTNSIIHINSDNKTFYFRECPEILPDDIFIKNAVSNFFENISYINKNCDSFKQEVPIVLDFSQQQISAFKRYIDLKVNDAGFISTLSESDYIAASRNFSIWDSQVYEADFFESFGLDNLPDEAKDIAIYFIWCMRSAAVSLHSSVYSRGDKHSFFGALKAMSMQIVADALGLSHMITRSQWCVLKIEGQKRKFGLISESAPGDRMSDITPEPTGLLQRELSNLNVLDVICCQTDHGPNNYTVINDKNSCRVCAFDNDNPNTFFPYISLSVSLAGCSAFVNKEGLINRPYLDSTLVECITSLNTSSLEKSLEPYLSFIQRKAVAIRINKLKKAISETMIANADFLKSCDEWNDMTVSKELNGNYGMTYLKKALNKK